MTDETDISGEEQWFYEERAKVAISNLQKLNIDAKYVSNRREALSAVLGMIPEGVTVGRADSVTLEQIGIIPELKKRNKNKLIDPFVRGGDGYWKDWAEHRRLEKEALLSNIFLTGTNAVTLDGRLVNVDGGGNRVAAMCFGPEKVIIVAGVNKIVKDVDEAMVRLRSLCAPMNAKRHTIKHQRPYENLACVKTGRCIDCTNELRICRYTVIIDGVQAADKERIKVLLVGERLGI